jgi:hypothetical protein
MEFHGRIKKLSQAYGQGCLIQHDFKFTYLPPKGGVFKLEFPNHPNIHFGDYEVYKRVIYDITNDANMYYSFTLMLVLRSFDTHSENIPYSHICLQCYSPNNRHGDYERIKSTNKFNLRIINAGREKALIEAVTFFMPQTDDAICIGDMYYNCRNALYNMKDEVELECYSGIPKEQIY